MTNGQLEAELLLYKGQCVYSIGRKMNFRKRANIKFCLKLGKTFTEKFELIKQVYGDNCLFRARVHESNVNEPKSSLRHMAMELNMSKDSIHRILTENLPREAEIP